MDTASFDVATVVVECATNDPVVMGALDQTFKRVNKRPAISVVIQVGYADGDDVVFERGEPRLRVRFKDRGDIDGYGYHNATKWVIRAAACVLEWRGTICLHSSGFIWHGCGTLVIGKTYRAGKTTLSLYAARSGADFLGDEYVFYDGERCFACPRFKSHIRVGTLQSFPELPQLAAPIERATITDLWKADMGHAVSLADVYGEGRIASQMVPALILFSHLDPLVPTAVTRGSGKEALKTLRRESLKHVAKLWLKPAEELTSSEVNDALRKLAEWGVDVPRRESLLTKLMGTGASFEVTGGLDFRSLAEEIERLAARFGNR